MRNYFKLIMVSLVVLIAMAIAGCSSATSYQKSVFDDESKIIKEGDSYSYGNRIGETKENKADIKFSSFSGMDTIYKITADEENDAIFDFEAIVDKGDFKVVLITPDDEIIDIVNGTGEGNQTVQLKVGTSRIKLVGKNAKGMIKVNIDTSCNVTVQD